MAIIFISKILKNMDLMLILILLTSGNKEISKSVKIDDIEKCSGINKKTLLEYNPEILREYTC